MQDSVRNHSSFPKNYVTINDLHDQWLKKQHPKVEEEFEEAGEEFPNKYVTINDLRERWLKKQQKEKDDQMRKANLEDVNVVKNDNPQFENPNNWKSEINRNLIEEREFYGKPNWRRFHGDKISVRNQGFNVNDSTLEKPEINEVEIDGRGLKDGRKKVTGNMMKKMQIERRKIRLINEKSQNLALKERIVERESAGGYEEKKDDKGDVDGWMVENEGEMKQIMRLRMQSEVAEKPKGSGIGKFRKKQVLGRIQNGVNEPTSEVSVTQNMVREKWFPVTGPSNIGQEVSVQEKLYWEMEEKMKEFSVLEKQFQEVRQKMKEKMEEVSLLEKRFQEVSVLENGNVLRNVEHEEEGVSLERVGEVRWGDRRAMSYRKMEVSARGRWIKGGGRRGNGCQSWTEYKVYSGDGNCDKGLKWVKKGEVLEKTD